MMLQQKPIEWRRFERVQLEGEVAKPAASRPVSPTPAPAPPYSSVSTTPSLLHEFERVLRENERLRIELSKLREKAAENAHETRRDREEQRQARPDITILASDNELQAAALQDAEVPDSEVPSQAAQKVSIARVVAGYIFDEPTEQNIRLISDALRARGVVLE